MNQIIVQIINFLKEELASIEEWEKAVFTTSITQNDSIFFDLMIFRHGNAGQRFIFDNIFKTRELVLNLNKESAEKRWNKGFFTIFPNGVYESEFVWDEEFYMKHEYNLARASISNLYERFYEILTFHILEEKQWETAVVTSIVKNESVVNSVDVLIEDQKNNFNIVLPEKWEEHLLRFYKKTNDGILKDNWPNWNTMIIKMVYKDYLDLDKDVNFYLV